MIFLLATLAHAEDLYVSSNIKGAAILLNGVETGFRTPATLHGVAPGVVEVAVAEGCGRGTSTVTVSPGVVTRVSVAATQQLGTLTLSPDPVQAKLFLDDAPFAGRVGAPTAVECGSHTLRAELYGYVPAVLAVDIDVNQDLTIPITLSPLGYAVLDLSVRPRQATLLVDNVPVGADAVTVPSAFAGGHTISAELDGYQTVKTQILLSEGESQAWHFEMVRSGKKNQQSTAVQLRGSGGGTTTVGGAASSAAASSTASKTAPVAEKAAPAKAPSSTTSTAKTAPAATSTSTAKTAPVTTSKAAEPKSTPAVVQPTVKPAPKPAKAKKEPEGDFYSRLRAETGAEPTITASSSETEAETEDVADLDEAPAPTTTSKAASRAAAEKAAAEKAAAEKAAEEQAAEEAAAEKAASKAAAEEAADEAAAEKAAARSAGKTSGKSTDKGSSRDEDGGKPGKTGRTVAGVSLLAVGAGAGGVGVYYYDRTQVAFDAYNAKLTAAKTQDNPALKVEANNFYDNTLVPRRNIMLVSGGASAACLLSGVIFVLVDDRLPILAPVPGGAMVRWNLSF